MGSDLRSFNQSALGAFIQSALGARGYIDGEEASGVLYAASGNDIYVFDTGTNDWVEITNAPDGSTNNFILFDGVLLRPYNSSSRGFISYHNGLSVVNKPVGFYYEQNGNKYLEQMFSVNGVYVYDNKTLVSGFVVADYLSLAQYSTSINSFDAEPVSFTSDSSTDRLTASGHTFSEDEPFILTSGSGATPLALNRPYLAVNVSGDTFQVKEGSNAEAVKNLTSSGNGVCEKLNVCTPIGNSTLHDNFTSPDINSIRVIDDNIYVVGSIKHKSTFDSTDESISVQGLAVFDSSWGGLNNSAVITEKWGDPDLSELFDVEANGSNTYLFNADMDFPSSGGVTDSIDGVAVFNTNWSQYAAKPAGVTQGAGKCRWFDDKLYYDYGSDGLFSGSSGSLEAAVASGVINDMLVFGSELIIGGGYSSLDSVAGTVHTFDGTTFLKKGVTNIGSVDHLYSTTNTVRAQPTVTITSSFSAYSTTDSISFSATAVDVDLVDIASSIIWESDIDGVIGTGGSISSTLTNGSHTITATAIDSKGIANFDSDTVFVGIEITSVTPTTGATAGSTSVTIAGKGFDGSTTVDFDGNSATSIVINSTIELTCNTPAGTGLVDVVVGNGVDDDTLTNGYTYSGSGDPPVVTITSPADSASFGTGVSISFSGTATDTEDGDISSNLIWFSDIDGGLNSGSPSASFSQVLSDGTHNIIAFVQDSDTNPAFDSVSITVG